MEAFDNHVLSLPLALVEAVLEKLKAVTILIGRKAAAAGCACPSIRLHLVKPHPCFALAHLPDFRQGGELRGLGARRAAFPVVDGLG